MLVGTARSTGWLCDLVGPVRPFSAVCNAVASADVSDVTVTRDVPDDVEVGSLVVGLLQREAKLVSANRRMNDQLLFHKRTAKDSRARYT